MATHLQRTEDETLYFITFTCYKWIPLFEITNTYSEVYKWFKVVVEKGARIVGFVIMPNHIHCLIYITKGGENLNRLIANGKRFMAYEIVKRLRAINRLDILVVLRNGVQKNEWEKGKKHKVFIPSFDSKVCTDDAQIDKMLAYIHSNPVKGKWNLADDYLDYEHSSARFYELGENHPCCDLCHYREM